MLAIPAIDIKNEKVVRLHKGDYDQVSVYSENPEAMIEKFVELGFRRIHIVDLEGSRDGKSGILQLLKKIKSKHNLVIEFGGGIRTIRDIEILIEYGIDKLIVGSMFFTNYKEFEKAVAIYGENRFILAADVLDRIVKIKGWTESSGKNVFEFITDGKRLGISEFLITDISLDGTLKGPSFALYNEIKEKISGIKIIASGGVSSMTDIKKLAAENYFAVVVGKAIYENKIDLEDLKKYAC
ncbi:MAG: 1-(5-phosphoribosyl)-5-[(5-phosphoribosylamino) methylideneamino] imidazole-4-carboxamide isomerase [Melioribacteraceae bacterium]|nr:MAG: 1-(5-phosphoribosyl)-5-[(5-phosphoribosylamino) methylideneamino] imidazole-4-carboxamide isomerase [Melioribacteraceae bacterium]